MPSVQASESGTQPITTCWNRSNSSDAPSSSSDVRYTDSAYMPLVGVNRLLRLSYSSTPAGAEIFICTESTSPGNCGGVSRSFGSTLAYTYRSPNDHGDFALGFQSPCISSSAKSSE